MSTFEPPSTFITFDKKGRPVVAGTSYRVIQVAMDHIGNGWSAAEIRQNHYDELSMAQVHAALSYYYEHQAEFDAEMERSLAEYEERWRQQAESPFGQRMRALVELRQTKP
jgi:uncharacterized protein (DUF433 family)